MLERLGLRIAGTGRFVPKQVLTNRDLETLVHTTDAWIRERTGIETRHVVGPGESTATLATEAGRIAIADAGMKPTDIDLMIIATITPECLFPSTACFVQKELAMRDVPAFDVSAACSGFIYALLVGARMIQGATYRNVLVIGAETMSRITDYQDRASCILFGDGAGACVLTRADVSENVGIIHSKMHASGVDPSMLWVPAGGSRLPASIMTVQERLHYTKMRGQEVYKLAVKRNMEVIESTLAEAGVDAADLAVVIPHQSNLRIIESAREKLGLPREKMFMNIQRCGNTSAASIPMGLDECRRTGRVKTGDLVLLVAFGAGLTWASALVRL